MPPQRRDESHENPDPEDTIHHDDRGGVVASTVRLLLVLFLFGALALGITMVAPQALDVVTDDLTPIDTEPPPPTGDRDPDTVHPDDPNETTYDTSVTITSEDVEAFVHHEVNDRRAEHGLDPIEWDGTVASVSRAHSVDMYEREYFDHTNPDGQAPYDRYEEVASYCRGYGENIAQSAAGRYVQHESGEVERYRTAEELADGLVKQWMNSPPHREAILEESWDRGGVGIYLADDGKVFATHNFCAEW